MSWRDHRRQTLELLGRLFTDDGTDPVVEPAGASELRVRLGSREGAVAGVILVAPGQVPLGLDALVPLLHRVVALGARARVVAYDGIAASLAAWGAEPRSQELVYAVRNRGFTPEEADRLLATVALEAADELDQERKALAFLHALAPTAAPLSVLDLLVAWTASVAETEAAAIGRDALGAKIALFAGCLEARKSVLADWGHILRPLEDEGAAPADWPAERLVVIHGGARAGRQRLAAGAAAEHAPPAWRYELIGVPDPRSATRLAATLATLADAAELPIWLVVSAEPRDRAWADSARLLLAPERARVVVSVDEAGWRRALLHGGPLPMADVGLVAPGGDDSPPPPPSSPSSMTSDDSWSRAGDELRALIKGGVAELVAADRELIAAAHDHFGQAWQAALDTDLAGARPVAPSSQPLVGELRARQSPHARAFAAARAWLAAGVVRAAPHSADDWRGFAAITFWSKRLGGTPPATPDEAALDRAVSELSIEHLAELALALGGLSARRDALLARFRADTATALVEDDGTTLCAHFIGTPPTIDEGLRRVHVLRALVPDRAAYAATGYGGPPVTVGPIAAADLPPVWLAEPTVWYVQQGELALRPADEVAYAAAVRDLRRLAVGRLRGLLKALDVHFRKQRGAQLVGGLIDVEEWARAAVLTSQPPRLPRTLVDAAGESGEGMIESPPSARQLQLPALREVAPYLMAARRFWGGTASFFRRALPVLLVNSVAGKGRSVDQKDAIKKLAAEKGLDPDAAQLSVDDLAGALEALPAFQAGFARAFAGPLADDSLDLLDREERDVFGQAFGLWHRFALHPGQREQEASSVARDAVDDAWAAVRARLRKALRPLAADGVEADLLHGEPLLDGQPALWVTFDVAQPTRLYHAYLGTVRAISGALKDALAGDLARHALDLRGRRLAVVGLIGGRSLSAEIWETPLRLRPGEAYGETRAVRSLREQRPVAEAEWRATGLKVWDDRRLATGDRFLHAVRELHAAVIELADLGRLPPGADEEVVRAHVAGRSRRITAALRALTEQTGEVLRSFEAMPVEEKQARPALLAAASCLADFYQNSITAPNPGEVGQDDLSLAQLAVWSQRLDDTMGQAEVFRLLWAADALGLAI